MSEQKYKYKMKKGTKALIIVLGVIVALAVTAVIIVYAMLGKLNEGAVGIETPSESSAEPTETPDNYQIPIYFKDSKDPNVLNVLILGTDEVKDNAKPRTDVMMLVSYNTKTNTVKMISFARDIWITNLTSKVSQRLNAASRYGGYGLTINTINEKFDLDIQNYVQLDFWEFTDIIDYLGGLDMELNVDEIDFINGLASTRNVPDLERTEGMHHLNGIQVLYHVRDRYVKTTDENGNVVNGDPARTVRQRKVLKLAFDKLKKANISQITSVINKALSMVETNMQPSDILSLGLRVVANNDLKFEDAVTVPFEGMYVWHTGGTYLPNFKKCAAKINEILYGDAEDTSASVVPTLSPGP